MRKKVIALFLVVVLIISSATTGMIVIGAKTNRDDLNRAMFENMLSNRGFVVDSLVYDNFQTNPYSNYVLHTTDLSLMDDVIDSFFEVPGLSVLVEALGMGEAAKQFLLSKLIGLGEDTLKQLGVFNNEGLNRFVDRFSRNSIELKYEGIINEVLLTDYEASWGLHLQESSAVVDKYKDAKTGIQGFRSILTAMKTFFGDYDSEDSLIKDAKDFIKHDDDLVELLETLLDDLVILFDEGLGISINDASVERLKSYFNISSMICVLPLVNTKSFQLAKSLAPKDDNDKNRFITLIEDTFDKNVVDALEALDKGADLLNSAVGQLVALETMVNQGNNTIGVLQRMKNNTADENIINTVSTYETMYNDAINDRITNSDIFWHAVSSEKVVSDDAFDLAGDFLKHLVKNSYAEEITAKISFGKLADQVASLFAAIKLGYWLADMITNLEDTAKAIYLCLYIKNLINLSVQTYESDYDVYTHDKSDENALKCINDLEFIKRLRLQGEKIAYDSMRAQTTSIAAQVLSFLSGDNPANASEQIKARYQASVDRLLGCTCVGVGPSTISVGTGETLSFVAMDSDYGAFWGITKKDANNKTLFMFPDYGYSLNRTKILIDGGTLSITAASNTTGNDANKPGVFVSEIECKKEGIICLNNATLHVNNLTTNNANIKLEGQAQVKINSVFECKNLLTFDNSTGIQSRPHIEVYDINNTGTIVGTDTIIKVTGSLKNTGIIQSPIVFESDTSVQTVVGNQKKVAPSISGTGTIQRLTINSTYKPGIILSETQTITDYFSCGATRFVGEGWFLLTGNCQIGGMTVSCPVIFEDFTLNQTVDFLTIATIRKTVTLNQPSTAGSFVLSNNCGTLNVEADTQIKGDFVCNGGTVKGSEHLLVNGDVLIRVSDPGLETLNLTGSLRQQVKTKEPLNLKQLSILNTSKQGVIFDSQILVSDKFEINNDAIIHNGKNVVLCNDAILEGDVINGDITFSNYNLIKPLSIHGTVFLTGNVILSDGTVLEVENISGNGTLTVEEGAELICNSNLLYSGALTNNGSVQVKGNSVLQQVNNRGCLEALGDLKVSSLEGGSVVCHSDLIGTGSISTDYLEFHSKTTQTVTSSASTDTLYINNTSKGGLICNKPVNVKTALIVDERSNVNYENLNITGAAIMVGDDVSLGNISVAGSFTIPEGKSVEIVGDLRLSGGALTIKSGASLVVDKTANTSGSSLNIEEGARLVLKTAFVSSGDTINNKGSFDNIGDTKLEASTIEGSGEYVFRGDLSTKNCTWEKPNIAIIGKVPQLIQGTTISANDLIVSNTSLAGTVLQCYLNYYGQVVTSGTIVNSERIIQK